MMYYNVKFILLMFLFSFSTNILSQELLLDNFRNRNILFNNDYTEGINVCIWINHNQFVSFSVVNDSIVNTKLCNYTIKYKDENEKNENYKYEKYVYECENIETVENINKKLLNNRIWELGNCNFYYDYNNKFIVKDGGAYLIEIRTSMYYKRLFLDNVFYESLMNDSCIYKAREMLTNILQPINLSMYYVDFLNRLPRGFYQLTSTLRGTNSITYEMYDKNTLYGW